MDILYNSVYYVDKAWKQCGWYYNSKLEMN